jgi:uncharacterized circularly permuted ATP-grasp superfamily protein/uncharacterized alpha-E superfamily protein
MDALQPALDPEGTGALWRDYRPLPPAVDELVDERGAIRPHWQPLIASLEALGPEERALRWEAIRHRLRENGVTYNVYDDPRGVSRPWTLDPVPLVMGPDEWSAIEAGLTQRAILLNLVLADLHGPQYLLRDGLVPPELLFANPAYLPACHGVDAPLGIRLVSYAADLGRGSDGAWQVLADRTQAPSGAGYALENRIALGSALPEAFGELRVHRLARFFATLRDTLSALAPRRHVDPRIVLLTPGPLNETYFEHAFLARYLGYTLVEGADLAVRDNGVFLKVLGGLQPVDVVLRRLDEDYCDPLELRSNSSLGVPGLLQAVRTGRVTVANALGAGLVETPALLAFLPSICRLLLGEELRMPSGVSWWCGEPPVLSHVTANLHRMVIKPAFPGLAREPVFGRLLDARQREALVARVRARPHEYVGQEEVAVSTAPVLDGNRLRPRHVGTRCYLVASGEGYAIMPGGLTRVAGDDEGLVVSMQRGGASKDTWVTSAQAVSEFSLLDPAGQPVVLTRGGRDLPSRVADSLFWLGRYTARGEVTIRLLRSVIGRIADRTSGGAAGELPALRRALAEVTNPGADAVPVSERGRRVDAELLGLLTDPARPGSLPQIVFALGRMARTVRDRISWDAWRIIAALDGALAGRPTQRLARPAEALERLDVLFLRLSALEGLMMEGTTRGEGWRFLDIGRRLERAIVMVRALDVTMTERSAAEPPLLEALLEFGDSLMTYRRRYQTRMQPHAVLDLLLADETNPRSVVFQLTALAAHVRELPREGEIIGPSPEERIVLEALTAVRLASVAQLARVDAAGRRPELAELLTQLFIALPALSEAISQSYLSHAQMPRQLSRFER